MDFTWENFKEGKFLVICRKQKFFDKFVELCFEKKIFFENKSKCWKSRFKVYDKNTCLIVIDDKLIIGDKKTFNNDSIKKVEYRI